MDHDLAAGVDAAALHEGEPLAGSFGDETVVLVRQGDRVCALAGTCTHLGAPMADGIVVDGELRCPWHHARFALDTGEAVGAPAFAPLARFETVTEDGRVRVTGPAPTAAAAPPAFARDPGRVVIIGAGAAGHACAEMLARCGATDVTLLGEEDEAPYDRTRCSKQYLSGASPRAETALPPVPGLRTGVAVTGIDAAARLVETATGERIGYDTLVLATGAAPVVPDFDGSDHADVHVVRSLSDADRLIAAAKGATHAVVIGASYIGLEVAAALRQREVPVTVVAQGAVPLAKIAGDEVGAMIRALHEEHGVTFRMDRSVAGWDGATVRLDDGSVLSADLLVAGTGVLPRLDLARALGLTLADEAAGGGVAVDATLATSIPGIFAIGDIASVPDPRLSHPIRVEHWVVAQRMGQWLARHLTGAVSGQYGEPPFFWSGHYDLNLRYVGHVDAPDDRTVEGDPAAHDVAVRFREAGREQALLTCARDRLALEREAEWQR